MITSLLTFKYNLVISLQYQKRPNFCKYLCPFKFLLYLYVKTQSNHLFISYKFFASFLQHFVMKRKVYVEEKVSETLIGNRAGKNNDCLHIFFSFFYLKFDKASTFFIFENYFKF